MRCIICSNQMLFFFSKEFIDYQLESVEYWKCHDCGFVASKTHFDMTEMDWQKLNSCFHIDNNNRQDNPFNRCQRYFHQATMLYLLKRYGILPKGEYLDWGCGRGELSDRLNILFDIKFNNYDKYIKPMQYSLAESDLINRSYACVVNSGVFEHVRSRETLDEIESYVLPYGCLAIHTLVRAEIPKDPDWPYLLPVHCAFHTNESMQRLMSQWGYTCSIYNEQAKMWILFRTTSGDIENKVFALNTKLGWNYLHFKDGFIDYWR